MLTIVIQPQAPPTIEVVEQDAINIEFDGVTVQHFDGEIYDGEYNVIPDFDIQTLETAQKLLIDDVTVEPIPVHRTDNPAGGKTIYIGGILEDA